MIEKREKVFSLFSTSRWLLGEHHTIILSLASLVQIIFALLDIFLLTLVGPLITSAYGPTESISSFSILGKSSISTREIIALIVLTVLLKNIAGLVVQKFVINSLATRQAEVGTALVQASFFGGRDNRQPLHSTNLLQTITSVIGTLFGTLFKPMIGLIGEIATLCAVVIGVLIINPQVAVFMIAYFSSFGYFIIRYIGSRQRSVGKISLDAEKQSLRAVSEIQIMSRELRLAHKDLDALITLNNFRTMYAKNSSNSIFLSLVPRYSLEMIFLVGIGALVIFLGYFQQDQQILPVLALVVAAGYRILPSLNYIATNFGNFKSSISSLEHMDFMGNRFGIRLTDLNFNQSKNTNQKIRFSGDLHLKNVSYQYPVSKKTIFTDFNLIIKSGQTILIEGLSGTGKSTLISLATGSLAPDRGCIFTVDGENEFAMDQNVTGISFLSQDVPLLDESFAYNIALEETFDKDVTRLKNAAAKAGILDRILESPMGFNTQIGENGSLLSAGERQRLGIARSLYSEPAFLILDEPTANLDAVSEKLVWDTLVKLKGKFTILIVSHRTVPEMVYDQVLKLPSST